MDIRVGNNIKLVVVLDNELSNIKTATCSFIKSECNCYHNHNNIKDYNFHAPSSYTLNTCNIYLYNCQPSNSMAHTRHRVDDCKHSNAYVDIVSNVDSSNTISCNFSKEYCCEEGTYSLIVNLFYTDGSEKHINRGEIFNLTTCPESIDKDICIKVYDGDVFIDNEYDNTYVPNTDVQIKDITVTINNEVKTMNSYGNIDLGSIKGEDGSQGPKGDKGDTGASAYDIWLSDGHTGTKTDFLNWLRNENNIEELQDQINEIKGVGDITDDIDTLPEVIAAMAGMKSGDTITNTVEEATEPLDDNEMNTLKSLFPTS